jgi:hypothetical protein
MGMWDRKREKRLLVDDEEHGESVDEQEPVLRSFLGSPERFRLFVEAEDESTAS